MPRDLKSELNFTAVELDEITSELSIVKIKPAKPTLHN